MQGRLVLLAACGSTPITLAYHVRSQGPSLTLVYLEGPAAFAAAIQPFAAKLH